MQNTPTLPLLPSTSFLSTFHSDLDFVPNKEESKFRTTVTDNNIELSFEVDCTRVTIKTQTTSLTLPEDLWRTLEAARHHKLHLAKKKSTIQYFLSPLIFKPLREFEKNKDFIH